MLYLVLVLVLASLGSLVGALIASSSMWAWLSTGLSIVAGVVLIADFLRKRSRYTGHNRSVPTSPETSSADELPEAIISETTVVETAKAEAGAVVVVDEHPHYHRTACVWLENRSVISLSVTEARDLGFTPCSQCKPDADELDDERKAS